MILCITVQVLPGVVLTCTGVARCGAHLCLSCSLVQDSYPMILCITVQVLPGVVLTCTGVARCGAHLCLTVLFTCAGTPIP